MINSLELSSFLQDQQQNNKKSLENFENLRKVEKVFLNDLETIEKISMDEEFWNEFNLEFSKYEKDPIKIKVNKILESIQEEDDIGNSADYKKTTQTVQLANNFLKNLALPLDEFQDNPEISRFSNRVSFRSSKFNRMSFEYSKSNVNNKSINVERLSRLSVMVSELENSQYFNYEKKEIKLNKNNDFVEKSVMLNLFQNKNVEMFNSMHFPTICYPLKKLPELKDKIDVLILISEVSLNILLYIEAENPIIETFVQEIEFLKGKVLNYLELIKSSETYLNENINTQNNYQQILFKKNLWIINLKKMASNLLNMHSLITRICHMQNQNEIIQSKISNLNNFFNILEDYQNLMKFFKEKALDTIQNYFGVIYKDVNSREFIKKNIEAKLNKTSNLFKTKDLITSFLSLLQPLNELIEFRSCLVPLFYEEVENIIIVIKAYTSKYKKNFNIFQNYTILVNEIFNFRRNQIKSLKLKVENFQEKLIIFYKNYSENTAKTASLNDINTIYFDLKNITKKANDIFSKIQKTSYFRFPLIEYEYLVNDLNKIKGLFYFIKDQMKLHDELLFKIAKYNILIKSSMNIKALQHNPLSLKEAVNNYVLLFQEFSSLYIWLLSRKKYLYIKEFSIKVKNSIEVVKINIECLLKFLKNFELNDKFDDLINVEEHQTNLWIAKIHKINKLGAIKETLIEELNIILENLETFIKKLKFYMGLAFINTDLKERVKKNIDNIEKNKIILKQLIQEKNNENFYEGFYGDIKMIKEFLKNQNEKIEKNDLSNFKETLEKGYNYINYLNELMAKKDFLSKDEQIINICNDNMGILNNFIQSLQEKEILNKIMLIMDIENLTTELNSLFSAKLLVLESFIKQISRINNILKNKQIQIVNENFIIFKQNYEEILDFLKNLIDLLEEIEKEMKRNQNKIEEFDKKEDFQMVLKKHIENFKNYYQEKLISKSFFEENLKKFFLNFKIQIN